MAYTQAGATYTQNFDALPDPGATSVDSGNTVTINGVTYSLANPYDFAYPVIASGSSGGLGISALAGWYGLSVLESRFGASAGDWTSGGQNSFGLPSSSNRALGLLATKTTSGTAFGLRLINGTANPLTQMNLQFTGEVWRQSNLPKTLQFYYAVDLTGTNAFPTSATAFLPALNVSLPTVSADAGGVAVDGTAALNQTNLGVLNQTITNWPPGAALWLVWQMTDSTGKAQGLGIDNLSFSATNSVAVTEVNVAPVLPTIAPANINELTLLVVTNTATEPNPHAMTTGYGLVNAPTGAVIDTNGIFRWTPSQAQSPGTNIIVTVVTNTDPYDLVNPHLTATNSFTVVVFAPTLFPINNIVANVGQVIAFTALATDNDITRKLTFSFGNAPSGATINSLSGLFNWRPPVTSAESSNNIQVIVTDNNVPPLGAIRNFSIFVNALTTVTLNPLFKNEAQFQLQVNGPIGPDYILQRTESLSSLTNIDWVNLLTNTPLSSPFSLTDTNVNLFINEFYRVQLEP